MHIRCLKELSERHIEELSELLIDCVEGGASVSFMLPMTREKALAFWSASAHGVARGERFIVIAEDDTGSVVGTVTVILNLPENQPHRADLAKMLVHRNSRRLGIGAAVLAVAEREAFKRGRTLLVLDTVTGSAAERLYVRQGWQRCGEIPFYALWPDGRPCPTTYYYKLLESYA